MRNRKPKSHDNERHLKPSKNKHDHNHHHHDDHQDGDSKTPEKNGWSNSIFYKVMLIAAVAVVISFTYLGFKKTRVNTPYSNEKLIEISKLDKMDYYWGTYRSGLYFGMKTRTPYSLVTGLMWYPQDMWLAGYEPRLRHWCDQNDKLERYSWLKHDGLNFGVQEIVDKGTFITTSFVKNIHSQNGGDWTAHINVTEIKPIPNQKRRITLLYYAATENKTEGYITPVTKLVNKSNKYKETQLVSIDGETEGLGYFKINFNILKGKNIHYSYLSTEAGGLSQLTETVLYNLRKIDDNIILPGEAVQADKPIPNFIVTHITADLPLELEVTYKRTGKKNIKENITGSDFKKALSSHEKDFDHKFEKIFKLQEKGFDTEQIKFAKAALSNMLGSIGYFYGSSQVQSEHNHDRVPYWKAPLFTAVPSRSFFPRGFLWDEGFHGLLLLHWNLDLEIDIISHWFDLMNVEGWIPREMILGEEALNKVPEEFVVQVNTNANPPTFLMTLDYILEHMHGQFTGRYKELLEKLYPRLQLWYNWYNSTQISEISSAYRWRGRDPDSKRELNPKTLTSGFDDYPRASHPSIKERHLDLRCWMALASKVMAVIAETIQKPKHKYLETYEYLTDNKLLEKLHWSSEMQRFADYGLHTDNVKLKKVKRTSRDGKVQTEMVREVLEKPEYRYVDSNFGYVSLFPLILRIIEPDSPKLYKILQDLKDPNLLWTNMGLRSLAKNSPLYNKYNTEHDPPYWRGAIWINVNYLAVSALHHYSIVEGPYRAEAKEIYLELRKNLIDNVFKQYKETGYLWENYGDEKGEGKGSHPFTGWSSLIVLIMAELY